MGCHSKSGQNSRRIERKSAGLAHPYEGANGSISCSTAVGFQLPERSHTAVFRQYNSCCLLKSSRGNKISPAFSPGHRDVVLVPGKEHHLVSSPHTRVKKFFADPVSSKKSFNRMDAESSSFSSNCGHLWPTDMDRSASALNHQVKRYVSWIEDPRAQAKDAFSVNGGGGERSVNVCILSFNLIQKCLQKVIKSRAQVLLVSPVWKSRPWYPILLDLLTDQPCPLPVDPLLQGGHIFKKLNSLSFP